MTIVTPGATIPRDRWSRPLVVPLAGGKPVPYTRCTTFVSVIDDLFNLQQWEKRMVALGLSARPDLLLAVAAHKDDKAKLNTICNDAKEAAAASAAATTGTALHALTELVDRGEKLPVLPADAVASLDAYREATADLTATHIEAFCVQDFFKIGGTPDRVVKYEGKSYIADVKTGGIDYGALKIAMQLSVYARSKVYDITTGERTPHGADIERGIVIHLPAGQAECRLYWIDLLAGWEAVRVAATVREKRKIKFPDLVTPFGPDLTTQLAASLPLDKQIEACSNRDAVELLWLAHQAEWTPELTTLARRHVAGMQEAS